MHFCILQGLCSRLDRHVQNFFRLRQKIQFFISIRLLLQLFDNALKTHAGVFQPLRRIAFHKNRKYLVYMYRQLFKCRFQHKKQLEQVFLYSHSTQLWVRPQHFLVFYNINSKRVLHFLELNFLIFEDINDVF